MTKATKTDTRLSLQFRSRLEKIAERMDYFAVPVPKTVTTELGTRGPVPVIASVNHSEKFVASFYPVGGGRHYLRVRNEICKAAEIKVGDSVHIRYAIRDRSKEGDAPADLLSALRSLAAEAGFKKIPPGQKGFLLRWLEQAAKPETRLKRIAEIVEKSLERQKK